MDNTIDLAKEIADDITIANSGQRHPDFLGLDATKATIDAQTFYFSSAHQNQAMAIRLAFRKQGYPLDSHRNKNAPKTDTKFDPRTSYELPTTSSTPGRSAHGGMGNNNAAKQSSKPKARGVAGGIAHGAHHLKDIERTDRSRKSKQAAKRT